MLGVDTEQERAPRKCDWRKVETEIGHKSEVSLLCSVFLEGISHGLWSQHLLVAHQ